MKENGPGWIPVRENDFSGQCTVDRISWDPNKIYDARSLEINTTSLNKYLHVINSFTDLKIGAITTPNNRSINISSAGKNGEALASNSTRQKKEKIREHELVSQANSTEIKINFQGIAERVEGETNYKNISERYPEIYGREVDRAFRKSLPDFARDNFFYPMGNLDQLGSERNILLFDFMLKAVPDAMVASAGVITTFFNLLNGNTEMATIKASTSLALLALYNIGISTVWLKLKGEKFSDFENYLSTDENGERRKTYEMVLRCIFPSYTIDNLVNPILRSVTWRKPIFRGKIQGK